MKKAYIFIETGEVRPAKQGESYLLNNEMCITSTGTLNDRIILARHEIEIPGHLSEIGIYPTKMGFSSPIVTIPIPRPKKKIKKWKWLACASENQGVFISGHYYTEQEWDELYAKNHQWSRKIPETEIEVEEE